MKEEEWQEIILLAWPPFLAYLSPAPICPHEEA